MPQELRPKKNLHLLVSVYLSPAGLGKYRLGYAKDEEDPYFRISRFLTSSLTLSSLDFKSIRIYFETDPVWQEHKNSIQENLSKIFPTSQIFQHRLLSLLDWQVASATYPDTDIILLQNNDDHAYVEQVPGTLDECLEFMASSNGTPLCGVTHFPEMEALKSRYLDAQLLRLRGLTAVPVNYAVGTTLVRADFFKSWWRDDKFDSSDLIAKPDNPLGKSVEFPIIHMLIPRFELMRHMDGYSHIKAFRPLAPLRNLVKFETFNLGDVDLNPPKFTIGYWPARIFSYSGRGVDLHATFSSRKISFIKEIRLMVGNLQSRWALRISFRSPNTKFHLGRTQNRLAFLVGILISLFTFPVFRNLPDWFIEKIFFSLLRLGVLRGHLEQYVSYKGFSRSLQYKLRAKRN